MRQNKTLVRVVLLLVLAARCGHAQSSGDLPTKRAGNPHARADLYFNPLSLHLDLVLPPPSPRNSPTTLAELNELHGIQDTRTPDQVAQARVDDHEETIFLFRSLIGPEFNADSLPLTAAFSKRIRDNESAASGFLKTSYHRPRPYQVDATLRPVCAITEEPNSYPSGHSLTGYLLGFTLIQMLPERRQQILDRADQYAHNRLICGVHYASDIEASRKIAYAIFGSLVTSPEFQKELDTARREVRQRLGLQSPTSP